MMGILKCLFKAAHTLTIGTAVRASWWIRTFSSWGKNGSLDHPRLRP